MTALLLTACVGMITGAFLIFRISPMDFTLGVFRRLTAGPKSIRDEINETTHRKKPGLFRREISEAQTILQATGKEEHFAGHLFDPCCSLPWVRASPSS